MPEVEREAAFSRGGSFFRGGVAGGESIPEEPDVQIQPELHVSKDMTRYRESFGESESLHLSHPGLLAAHAVHERAHDLRVLPLHLLLVQHLHRKRVEVAGLDDTCVPVEGASQHLRGEVVENRTNGAVRSGGVLGLVVIDKLLETNWKRSVSIQRGRGSRLARRTEKLGFSYVQRNNGIDTFYLRGTEGDQPSFACRQAPSARGAAGKEADKCYGVQSL